MALQITQTNETYNLKGQINTSSRLYFTNFFKSLLLKERKIIVNIEEVNEIDKQGLQAVFLIIKAAQKINKKLVVIGYGCKDVYDEFNQKIA